MGGAAAPVGAFTDRAARVAPALLTVREETAAGRVVPDPVARRVGRTAPSTRSAGAASGVPVSRAGFPAASPSGSVVPADFADFTDFAVFAVFADSAVFADLADFAGFVDVVVFADFAVFAGFAGFADFAGSAAFAVPVGSAAPDASLAPAGSAGNSAETVSGRAAPRARAAEVRRAGLASDADALPGAARRPVRAAVRRGAPDRPAPPGGTPASEPASRSAGREASMAPTGSWSTGSLGWGCASGLMTPFSRRPGKRNPSFV
ncbi:hypothetical protein GCM10027160_41060 [Streptomyces calidiresistens]